MEEPATSLIKVTDSEILKKYGWKEPYHSYVIATPSLWEVWLRSKKQSDALAILKSLRPVSGTDADFDYKKGKPKPS